MVTPTCTAATVHIDPKYKGRGGVAKHHFVYNLLGQKALFPPLVPLFLSFDCHSISTTFETNGIHMYAPGPLVEGASILPVGNSSQQPCEQPQGRQHHFLVPLTATLLIIIIFLLHSLQQPLWSHDSDLAGLVVNHDPHPRGELYRCRTIAPGSCLSLPLPLPPPRRAGTHGA